MQSVYLNKKVILQASSNLDLCVVNVVRRMVAQTPTYHPMEPFIMSPTTRGAVSVESVRKYWNNHLKKNKVDITRLSLHSLRKGAATAAHQNGCDELQIQKYWGWQSNAHRLYITPSQTPVNAAITRALATSDSVLRPT